MKMVCVQNSSVSQACFLLGKVLLWKYIYAGGTNYLQLFLIINNGNKFNILTDRKVGGKKLFHFVQFLNKYFIQTFFICFSLISIYKWGVLIVVFSSQSRSRGNVLWQHVSYKPEPFLSEGRGRAVTNLEMCVGCYALYLLSFSHDAEELNH